MQCHMNPGSPNNRKSPKVYPTVAEIVIYVIHGLRVKETKKNNLFYLYGIGEILLNYQVKRI